MPMRFVPSFTPQTQAGGALQGVIASLFGGETPVEADDRVARVDLHRAQRQHFDAQTAKVGAEEALLRDKLGALQAEDDWVAAVTGQPVQNVRAVRQHLAGDPNALSAVPGWVQAVAPEAPVAATPGAMPAQAADGRPLLSAPPQTSRGKDRGLHPEARAIAEALATVRATRATQPNNPNDIGKAYSTGLDRVFSEDVRNSRYAPADAAAIAAALDGKPLMDAGAGGQVYNRFTGDPGPDNPVSLSTARENNAQADRASGKNQVWVDTTVGGRKVQVSREDMSQAAAHAMFPPPGSGKEPDPLVRYQMPDGSFVMIRQSDISRAAAGSLFKQPKARTMTAGEQALATKTIGAGLDGIEQDQGARFDADTRRRLHARAMELTQTEDYGGNAAGALDAALREMYPDGFDVTGKWNPFKENMIAPGKAATPTAPAAPATPAPQAQPSGGGAPAQSSMPRPRNKQEFDALPPGTRFIDPEGKTRVKGGA